MVKSLNETTHHNNINKHPTNYIIRIYGMVDNKFNCMKKIKKIIKIIDPYCHKIVYGKKHLKAYPKNSDMVIVISKTSSDQNQMSMIYRDFRRAGIELPEDIL